MKQRKKHTWIALAAAMVFVAVIAIGLWRASVPRQPVVLTTGMPMREAVSQVQQRGLPIQQMAYAVSHNAFNLDNGTTVVLLGNMTVNEIQLVMNPEAPKANRVTKSLATVQF